MNSKDDKKRVPTMDGEAALRVTGRANDVMGENGTEGVWGLDFAHRDILLRVEALVQAITDSTEPGFVVIPKGAGMPRFQATSLGEYYEHLEELQAVTYRGDRLSARARLFFECLDAMDLFEDKGEYPEVVFPARAVLAKALRWNDLIERIRQHVRRQEQDASKPSKRRRTDRDWAYSCERNFQSAVDYVTALLECHTQLLVVPVRLAYLPACQGEITLEQVCQDVQHLLRNLRWNMAFAHLKGYVWRIDGDGAGYQVAFTLFYDQRERGMGRHCAQSLGAYWTDMVTQGKGLFELIGAPSGNPEDDAMASVALIDREDHDSRSSLLRVLQYLYRDKRRLEDLPKCKGRLFGRGMLPR